MISTKGRYALRVMIDLAEQSTDKYIPLEEIAARQQISKKYLEIIIKSLVKEQFLTGVRGKGGGYRLTRHPSEYRVYEILEVAEGTLRTVSCLKTDSQNCPRKEFCKTLPMWQKYDRLVYDFFNHITLEDLVRGNI